MKELENDIIKKYSYKDYVVYVKTYDNSYECYLQKESYGNVYFMFGLLKEYQDLETIEQTIIGNIEEYIEFYKEEYEYLEV